MKIFILCGLMLIAFSAFADSPVKTSIKGEVWEEGHCTADFKLIEQILKSKCSAIGSQLNDDIGIKVIHQSDSCIVEAVSFCEN